MSAIINESISPASPHVADARRAARAERHACFLWSSFVLLLLGGSISMWIYAAVLAVSDPSMAVVPDYHEKALKWDEHLAAQRASSELAWTVAIVPGPVDTLSGRRELTLFVRDKDAQPVTGASGQVRLYHHARGKAVATHDLKETDPGTYVCQPEMLRSGSWQIEVQLDRDDSHWEQSIEYQLGN